MSNGFKIVGLDHVTITAPEELVEEAVSWYRACLGLEEIDKPEGTQDQGVWLRAGDQEIHIKVDPHNPSKSAHFCLVVDDFDGAIHQLRGQQCHIEQAMLIPGRRRCFTRDPAGNQVEIVAVDEDDARVEYEEGMV